MTTAFLLDDLKADEGLRLEAYPDPKTRGAPWTIGYGHCGPEVHAGLCWGESQAKAVLAQDVGKAIAGLDRAIPWWAELTDARQDVLVNMAFNIGVSGLLEFKHALAAMRAGDFAEAKRQMLWNAPGKPTDWYVDTKRRAERLARQMETGVR